MSERLLQNSGNKTLDIEMEQIGNTSIGAKLKEMLIVMTALLYTEQNNLLSQSQMRDAKQSLQALFLRTSVNLYWCAMNTNSC